MEKAKENKSLDKVTDKVSEKEMAGGKEAAAAATKAETVQSTPKIKPTAADLKILTTEFVSIFQCMRNHEV